MSQRSTGRYSKLSIELLACLAALALAVSCASTAEKEEAADTGSEFQQGDQEDVEVRTEPVEETTVSGKDMLNLQTIYFDFDKSNIRENARPMLRANGQQLRTSGVKVRLEGYCDERGDEEYNLALGERRAQSTKRYLENLGVPAQQMRTLSYGEAKPAVPGHNEAAWRYNRRVEFKTR